MEDIHDLSTKFKNLVKETEKVMFDYVDSKILEESDELLELKAVNGLNTVIILEQCYLVIVRKLTELHCNLQLENFRQSAQLIFHYRNFYDKATKEGEALYLRIHKKLITSSDPETNTIVSPQPFAFNVRFFGDTN